MVVSSLGHGHVVMAVDNKLIRILSLQEYLKQLALFFFFRAETNQHLLGFPDVVPSVPKRHYHYGNFVMDKENMASNVRRKYNFDAEMRSKLTSDDVFRVAHHLPELGFRHPNLPCEHLQGAKLLAGFR